MAIHYINDTTTCKDCDICRTQYGFQHNSPLGSCFKDYCLSCIINERQGVSQELRERTIKMMHEVQTKNHKLTGSKP